MGVITNGPGNHQNKKVENLNLNKWINEDNIFISEIVNMSKPDEKLFKFVQEKMDLDLDNTFYIGDSYDNDVIGAKRAGWKMIWINRRNSKIPENAHFYPDYIVKNDKELLDLLKNNIMKPELLCK